MLLTKEVEVRPTGKMIQYYKDKGYDAKYKESLIVSIEDLPRKSNVCVTVVCDFCSNVCEARYVDYCNSIEIDGTYACTHCSIHKAEKTTYKKYGVLNYSSTKECREKVSNTLLSRYGVDHISKKEEFLKKKCNNNKKKYGVEHTLQVEEFREKGIETMKNKYGVSHALQNEEIMNRMKNTVENRYGVQFASQNQEIKDIIFKTNLEKYGYKSVLSSPEIKKKISKTVKDIYGVDNVSQCEEVKQKKIQTMLSHYGVKYPSYSSEIVEKRIKTLYKNGTTPTSSQQLYIYNLYKSTNLSLELNYPISRFNADICLLDEKIDIEIDFGGHNLSVKFGNLTQEEFNQKEIIRNNIIKREGYKQMRIISNNDYLPSDTILLQMLEQAKQYFTSTNHSWCTYDIDQSLLFNAENKDGVPYNYGELRRIKKTDIIEENSVESNQFVSLETA